MAAPAHELAAPRASATSRVRDWLRLTLLANHFPALHGVRVLAILSVVQVHITGAFVRIGLVAPTGGFRYWHRLWLGMDLFFLLSGFLIGSMLLVDEGTGRAPRMGRFYFRRALRIMPAYFVTLTTLVLLYPLTPLQRLHLPWEYLYLTNYVPPLPELTVMPWGWSLALEEHFYLAVPFLLMALRLVRSGRAQLGVLGVLWLSGLAVRVFVYLRSPVPWNIPSMVTTFYVQTHLRYDILIAGIFTAVVQRRYGEALRAWLRSPPSRWALAALSAIGLALTIAGEQNAESLPWNLLCWGTFTSLAYVPLVLLLLNSDGSLVRFLSVRPFLLIATLGYGIYLWHVPVIEVLLLPLASHAIRARMAPVSVVWVATLLSTILVSGGLAYLLHVLVEKPALALRDRFSR